MPPTQSWKDYVRESGAISGHGIPAETCGQAARMEADIGSRLEIHVKGQHSLLILDSARKLEPPSLN